MPPHQTFAWPAVLSLPPGPTYFYGNPSNSNDSSRETKGHQQLQSQTGTHDEDAQVLRRIRNLAAQRKRCLALIKEGKLPRGSRLVGRTVHFANGEHFNVPEEYHGLLPGVSSPAYHGGGSERVMGEYMNIDLMKADRLLQEIWLSR